MASAPLDSRRAALSPKPKGRENAKDTLCRNVTIYGHCRFEDKGCAFNHDPAKGRSTTSSSKRLNVESPSFTPNAQHAILAAADPGRGGTGLSPKAANAAPFRPKGLNTGAEFYSTATRKTYNPAAPEWAVGENGVVQSTMEFLPHTLQQLSMNDADPGINTGMYDAFGNPTGILGHQGGQQSQMNPYAHDSSGGNTSFFPANTFSQPTNYHLYAPMGPYKEPSFPYQRTAADFFIPDSVREDLQRKSAEILQILPNSTLPPQIEHFHSLVPLDKTNQRNSSHFGYPSWIYKTMSAKDGNYYALRRLEGFKLSSEKPIRTINAWKRVRNANIVSIQDAFTSRAFNGESSLMIVTDYHPLAKTLQETHIASTPRTQSRQPHQHVPEPTLWMYIVQIANALRAIHANGLAARLIDLTKILVTSKDRIRLNGCSILDIVQYDLPKPLLELQKEDFRQFGRLIVALGTGRSSIQSGLANSMDAFNRAFSQPLKDRVFWLLNQGPERAEGIEKFMAGLEGHVFSVMDGVMSAEDHSTSILNTALEDGRIVRLTFKLNTILERPLTNGQFADGGERGVLRLFRDFVFHQADHSNSPVLDLAHMLSCLNKLDAGSEEKIVLTSRDDQTVHVVSYKEMKTELSRAFDSLKRAGNKS